MSRDARELAELSIVERLLEASVSLPDPPDPTFDNQESAESERESDYIFICGRCDMIIHREDKACEFCGAEFEDADMEVGDGETVPAIDRPLENIDGPVPAPIHHRPMALSQMPSAEKVDVIGLLEGSRSRLGDAHIAGGASNDFLSYARMLRAIEGVISEAGNFGVETGEARKTLLAAWKACHEGRWDRALKLADESKRLLAPGLTSLIDGQLFCLREAILEMKRKGRSISSLVVEIKTIQKDLVEMRLEEAMRSTKAIISEIKKIQMHILDNINSPAGSDQDRTTYRGQGI